LIGRSPVLREAVGTLLAAAPSSASVLVTGECGTGKELAARVVHQASHRLGAFVPVDCASVASERLAGDLTASHAPAMRGASLRQPGLVAQAAGGTLFLDEVCDLSLAAQAALLRALDDEAR